MRDLGFFSFFVEARELPRSVSFLIHIYVSFFIHIYVSFFIQCVFSLLWIFSSFYDDVVAISLNIENNGHFLNYSITKWPFMQVALT